MIIFIRNIMYKKNIYKVFLWIFLLMFIGGGIGIGLLQRGGGSNSIAIKVCSEETTRELYYKNVRSAEKRQQYYKSQGVTFADADPRRDALRKLVKDGLEKDLMSQLVLSPDEAHVQKSAYDYLQYLPDMFFDANGRLNEDLLKQHFDVNLDELHQEMRSTSKKEVLDGILDSAQYVSQFELNAQYNKEYADKVVEILSVSPTNYKKSVESKDVSEKALKSFYKRLKGNTRFKTKKRAGQYWTFDSGSYDVNISDKEISREYDKRKKKEFLLAPAEVQVRQIFLEATDENRSEIKERLKGIHQELKENPESFANVAKKVSEDKATASKGGLMPFFKKDSKDHDALLVKKAFETLTKDGQISQVIKIKDGYVLLQRVSRKKTQYKELKSVKSQLEQELFTAKFEKRFMQAAKRMISQVKYKPEMFQTFVDKHHGIQKELTLSSRGSDGYSAILFRTEEGRYNVTIDSKGNGLILLCSKVEPSVLKPLAEVESQVKTLYYQKEAGKLMKKDIQKVLDASSDKSFEDLASLYNMKYEKAESNYVNGERKDDNALKIYQIQKELPLLQFPGDVAHVEMAHGDAVLRLESISDKNDELFEAKMAEMTETLAQAEKYKKRDAFIASLGRNAIINNKIEIEEEFKP